MNKSKGTAKSYKCVLCKKRFHGFGNNPAPLSDEGKCCDGCNEDMVVPTRLEEIAKKLTFTEDGEVDNSDVYFFSEEPEVKDE